MSNEIENIYEYLSIKVEEWSQDPEIENADNSRVVEFCDVYEKTNLTVSQKEELMKLIIASLDEELDNLVFNQNWEKVQKLLKADYEIHRETVEYWSHLDEKNEENVFRITPYIRVILFDIMKSENPS